MRMRTIALLVLCSAASLTTALFGAPFQTPPDVAALQQTDPPPNGVWVDTLDLTKVQPLLRRGGRGGNRGGAVPATPPAPPIYALGGVTYPHTLPLASDRDITIDLKGRAVRFASMVGIDSAVPSGRGSVIFGVWVDGKKVADSGLLKGGDAPKMLTANLAAAKHLVLAVIDGNDGTGNDNANWGGPLITMAAGAEERPEIVARQVEAMPPIASSRSITPLLNYPRITGASVGKPFMFLIPASGQEPLVFTAKNLPPGLSLDAKTGLITGRLQAEGRTPSRDRHHECPGQDQRHAHHRRRREREHARADAAARVEFVERVGQHRDGRSRQSLR